MDLADVTAAGGRIARRLAYRVLGVWWFLRRPHTHGVKLVIRHGDDVLFVRHAYGNRRVWEFPGGGMKRGESPAQAARREAREELGVDITTWTEAGTVTYEDYATAHLTCLTAPLADAAVQIHRGEIEEARWIRGTTPPAPLGAHARAALDLPAIAALLR
ncbi:MAG TPA: NUDIX hydrolase [Solirubrobacteraceae bacterium]